MDDDELGDVLGDATVAPTPTAEALQTIVDRSRRRGRRALAAAVVLLLVAGGLVAASVSGGSDPPTAAVAGERQKTEGQLALGSWWEEATEVSEEGRRAGPTRPLERLFLRSSGGVAIRAYLGQPLRTPSCPPGRSCPPPPPPQCVPESVLRAELSNEGAVTAASAAVWSTPPPEGVAVLRVGLFGVRQGSPARWVAVHAGAEVRRVRVRLPDGSTDEMEPVRGFAVLAHGRADPSPGDQGAPSRGPAATLEGLDESGRVVVSRPVTPGSPERPPGCPRPSRRGERGPGPRAGRGRGGVADEAPPPP